MYRFLLPLPLLLLLLLPATAAIWGRSNPVDTYGDGRGASCERGNASFCRPSDPKRPLAPVPGPLPVLGLWAFYARARSLRSRILASQGHET